MKKIIDRLISEGNISADEVVTILRDFSPEEDSLIFAEADRLRRKVYGDEVYIRGLIEISNHCKNNCFYCGIRCGNKSVERYRLTSEDILTCCENGYALGFRTFVMQGGEDGSFTDELLCKIIGDIKKLHPDCAVTLSLGERGRESFQRLFDAGADRYLLRHETASCEHYGKLHPSEMSFENRMKCLHDLKEIGFQTGAGFMVGSPYQTVENLAADLMFLKDFKPHMVGIGPFIPSTNTPFADFSHGSLRDTLIMVALTRILLPNALIPSTTALGTLIDGGREMGLKVGANVVMPNLSPETARSKYALYNNKLSTGVEAAEGLEKLKKQVADAGYRIVTSRGDCAK